MYFTMSQSTCKSNGTNPSDDDSSCSNGDREAGWGFLLGGLSGEAMAGADWVGSEIRKLVPGAIVEVSDLHGTGDHFHVRVISDSFDGMLTLDRQTSLLI